MPAVGGKLPGSPLRFPARHGLGVAWTDVEDHSPEPPGLRPVTALLGQDSEVPQCQVAVDALLDATEPVGTLQGQDPPPAGFGLGPLGSGPLGSDRVFSQLKTRSDPAKPPPRSSTRGHSVLAIGAPLSLPSDQINHSNLAVLTAV